MWQRIPIRRAITPRQQPASSQTHHEPFRCDTVCRDRAGQWDDSKRAERACRRLDLPIVKDALNTALLMPGYMGRRPEPGLTRVAGRKINPEIPLDDPAGGCPGAWARCRFVLTLVPYLRRRTEGGGRVQNHLLDRCEDDFVHACVGLVEGEQERHVEHSLTHR